MNTSEVITYHKQLADTISPILADITSFTNGMWSRINKSHKLMLAIYKGHYNSLEFKFWSILSAYDDILCSSVPMSYPLQLNEFYIGRRDRVNRPHIWEENITRQRRMKHYFTEEERNVIEKLWQDIDNTLVVIKSSPEYNQVRKTVTVFEIQLLKVKTRLEEYYTSQ